MVQPFPAPSLRELLSAAKLRECTSVNVNAQKFQSSYALVCKSLAWRNHRTTLPQSRIRSTAPSEREPGWGAYHSTGYSLKSGVTGDFHRPYEGSDFFTFHRSSGYSLKLGVNLFQEICNIVSVQGEGHCGVLMCQIIACAGQEVGDVEGGFCFRGLEDDGGNAAGFQHQ